MYCPLKPTSEDKRFVPNTPTTRFHLVPESPLSQVTKETITDLVCLKCRSRNYKYIFARDLSGKKIWRTFQLSRYTSQKATTLPASDKKKSPPLSDPTLFEVHGVNETKHGGGEGKTKKLPKSTAKRYYVTSHTEVSIKVYL